MTDHDMTAPNRTSPIRGLHPTVLLGDGQWDRVIHALYQRNTKADTALAWRIVKQVETVRTQAREHEATWDGERDDLGEGY